ncbi:hypothetical protein SSX86_003908 [Deinandra increscens subsp. villosa]|uniref:Uncharacterized protein n=1 Tax=Deinandra increscens subsp. villosa TaxID=3103831 RepID=A0AAP0H8I0_9ASTR
MYNPERSAIVKHGTQRLLLVHGGYTLTPHQVSKTAPTGEYLTVGSFMIRGIIMMYNHSSVVASNIMEEHMLSQQGNLKLIIYCFVDRITSLKEDLRHLVTRM